ncbi:MAG: tetratricopeptide repeat protein [Desulfobulbaceae bacterium]|nr:tetratricopeptide repeat protein [Desulfobulbaceae bacterium]
MADEMASCLKSILLATNNSVRVKRGDGCLAVPIKDYTSNPCGVFVHGIDAALLRKISDSYLMELPTIVSQCFIRVKERYIDPLSGRYNSRCLFELFKDDNVGNRFGFLFLVKIGGKGREADVGLAKCSDMSFLLETVVGRPLFYLSSGIWAFFYETSSRKDLLDFSHSVVYRLKQNRFSSVHIASSALSIEGEKRSAWDTFEECWLTLERAENVGPYGLKCGPSVYPGHYPKFSPPPDFVLDRIRRDSRGLKSFGLALVRLDGNNEEFGGNLGQLFATYLPEGSGVVPLGKNESYIFFPEFTEEKLRNWGERIKNKPPWAGESVTMSVGMSYWPCLRYTKSAIALNCQKALLHGGFYGPGQVTCFDNTSLNVSGDYYFDEGDYREAVKEYRQGLQLCPDDINLMNSLGVALTEVNQQGLAVSWFGRVLEMETDNYMALVNLGFAMRRKGQLPEAIWYLEKAYQLRGDTEESLSELVLQLGDLYCLSGSYEKAAELFRQWRAEQFGRREFHFHRLLGEALMEMDDHEAAIRHLQKALQCYPGSTDSMSMLGLLYVKTGQGVDVGISLCRKAVTGDSHDADNWRRFGYVYLELSDFDEALHCAHNSFRLKKFNNERTKLLLANIYEKMKRYKKAGDIYQNILKSPRLTKRERRDAKSRLGCLRITEK